MSNFKLKGLSEKQNEILEEIYIGGCLNQGVDDFKCNIRTLKALEKKGLIWYGKFSNGRSYNLGVAMYR